MIIDKSIKYAANTVVKEKSNRPLNKGGWVIDWNGEDYICFTDGIVLFLFELPVGNGLEKNKIIPMRKEVLNLEKDVCLIEPIDKEKVKINGLVCEYLEGAPNLKDVIFTEEESEILTSYIKIDPAIMKECDKFIPGFWKKLPLVKKGAKAPVMWKNENKMIFLMPVK